LNRREKKERETSLENKKNPTTQNAPHGILLLISRARVREPLVMVLLLRLLHHHHRLLFFMMDFFFLTRQLGSKKLKP
jgi:hypothetical protein